MGVVDWRVIVAYACVIVGYGLIPLLIRQPVTSAYKLLKSRLGMSIRKAGVSLLLCLAWMASIAPAISVTCAKDLGLPLTTSIVWNISCSLRAEVLVGAVASAAARGIHLERNL